MSTPEERFAVNLEKLRPSRGLISPSRVYWKSSCVTFLSAIIAFVLGLLVLLSSASNGALQSNFVVEFNMSTLGQNAIKISPATASNTQGAINLLGGLKEREAVDIAMPAPTAPPSLEGRDPQLPTIGDITSFFGSVSSKASGALASATIPGIPLPTGTDAGSSILNGLESIVSGVAGNLTNTLGNDLIQVSNKLVETVLDAAGINQWHGLYMMQYCSGEYKPSYSDPNAKLNITKCTRYTDASILNVNQTNSNIVIGNSIVDFSALNVVNKLGSTAGSLKSILLLFIVLQILGIASCGLLIVIIPPHFLFMILQNRLIRLVLSGLAGLGAGCFVATAVIVTGVALVMTGAVNQLAGDLGLKAGKSSSALAMLWVSAVVMGISATFWFVEFFRGTFVRRSKLA